MRDVRIHSIVAILALTIGIAGAQNEPSGLRFEAASIRPSAPGGPPISGTTINANRMRGTKVTLFGLIRSAFGDGLTSVEQFVGAGQVDDAVHGIDIDRGERPSAVLGELRLDGRGDGRVVDVSPRASAGGGRTRGDADREHQPHDHSS